MVVRSMRGGSAGPPPRVLASIEPRLPRGRAASTSGLPVRGLRDDRAAEAALRILAGDGGDPAEPAGAEEVQPLRRPQESGSGPEPGVEPDVPPAVEEPEGQVRPPRSPRPWRRALSEHDPAPRA